MKIFKNLFKLFKQDKVEKKDDKQNPVTDVFQRATSEEEKQQMSAELKEKQVKIGQAKPQLPTKSVAQKALRRKTPLDRYVAELKTHGIEVTNFHHIPLVDTGLVKRAQNDQFIQMARRMLTEKTSHKMKTLLTAEEHANLSEKLNVLLPSPKIDLHVLENILDEERVDIFRTIHMTRYKILSQVLEKPITLVFVDPQDLDSGSEDVTVAGEGASGEPIRIIVPKNHYIDEIPLMTD